jgi:glycogen(starch) synthase
LRVLLLGPFPPPHGGVQTHLVALRQLLRKRGASCAVINITGHRKTEHDEVYYPRHALGLIQLLIRLRYDVVHLHFGGNLTIRLIGLAFVCSLIPRAKTVLTFHSGGYPRSTAGKRARRWSVRGFVLRRLDRVIGVNEELADMFHRFGVPRPRVRVIAPHAFPVEPSSDRPEDLRAFFEAHDPVLLTVGGLEPEYDLPRQIAMLGIIRKAYPKAGLAIVGAGSLQREVRADIDSRSYREHVLLCGDVPHSITLGLMADSDLLLRTTLYDGDSIAIREALHLGAPVVATDNGMRPEGVRLVAEPGPKALARAVEQCLRAVARHSTRGRDTAEQNLEQVWNVYAELTGAPQDMIFQHDGSRVT